MVIIVVHIWTLLGLELLCKDCNMAPGVFGFEDSLKKCCKGSGQRVVCANPSKVEPRKLEHGFGRISARIPFTLP